MNGTSFLQLQCLVSEEFGVSPEAISRDTVADDIDGWDSISHAILIVAIERQYGIRFPNEDIYTPSNVGALYDRIMELHSSKT